jgi:uncharacterized membrane protein YkvA (DUF1232 family)
MKTLLLILVVLVAAYIIFIVGLMLAGNKTAARAVAGLIPDCIVLFKNLLKDKRVPPRHKVLLWILIGYLLFPIDIVPDFIPVAGQLDDAIIVVLVLRAILKHAGSRTVKDNWRGPESTLRAIFKIARIDYS